METNEMKETKTTIKEKWENLKEKKWFRRTVIGLGIGAGIGGAVPGDGDVVRKRRVQRYGHRAAAVDGDRVCPHHAQYAQIQPAGRLHAMAPDVPPPGRADGCGRVSRQL